jgi:hypothetical protein
MLILISTWFVIRSDGVKKGSEMFSDYDLMTEGSVSMITKLYFRNKNIHFS